MRYLSYFFALVTATFLGGAFACHALPEEGSVVQGTIEVGNYTAPLPQGSWTVLSSKETQVTRKVTFKRDSVGHVPIYRVVLAQAQGDMLHGIIQIEGTSSFEAKESYSAPHPITLTQAYFAESFSTPGNARGKPSVMYIDPYHFRSDDFGGVVKTFIENNHLAVSDTTFVGITYKIVRNGGYLTLKYIFNPGVQGGALNRTHADAGRWHPTQHELWVAEEKAILDSYAQWAKGFQHEVVECLQK